MEVFGRSYRPRETRLWRLGVSSLSCFQLAMWFQAKLSPILGFRRPHGLGPLPRFWVPVGQPQAGHPGFPPLLEGNTTGSLHSTDCVHRGVLDAVFRERIRLF